MYLYQVETKSNCETFSFEELKEKFTIRGWNENLSQRTELHDQPKLQGFVGPMYNGKQDDKTIIRYESIEEYATYSN